MPAALQDRLRGGVGAVAAVNEGFASNRRTAFADSRSVAVRPPGLVEQTLAPTERRRAWGGIRCRDGTPGRRSLGNGLVDAYARTVPSGIVYDFNSVTKSRNACMPVFSASTHQSLKACRRSSPLPLRFAQTALSSRRFS